MSKKHGTNNVNSFVVVRASSNNKVKAALNDLVKYGQLKCAGAARRLDPSFADNILIHVMKSPLRTCCNAASIVPLTDEAGAAINKIRNTHPPAHAIIVSPRNEVFYELMNYVDLLPELRYTHGSKESTVQPISKV